MSLKINYLDNLKNSYKNIGIFVSKDTKIADFRGIFSDNISKKVLNYTNANKKSDKNKIFSINEDHDKTIFVIFLSKKNSSNEAESLGAKFYDQIKNQEIKNISIFGLNSLTIKKYIKIEEFIHEHNLNLTNSIFIKQIKNKIIF